ncbi:MULTISPECIES: hypothetical protein [Sphingobium]|nr:MULTISPECIES: hypothetical protein [Sphingobium]
MKLVRSLIQGWIRLYDAARHEFLRDPTVVLFERAATNRESARGR